MTHTKERTEECPGCGVRLPALSGPTHEYMESSPGCWKTFGSVLAREYSNRDLLEVHRLSVDAYAVQHPGRPGRRSIQSVGVHLVRLCLFLEHGLEPERANRAMLAAARRESTFRWLEPPTDRGPLTAADIAAAATNDEHKERVRRWATQMWSVWAPHHATVRSWATAEP